MADTDHSELVARFTSVTGVDADRAKFYLESAAWNLDVAIAGFYDDDEDGGGEVGPVDLTPQASQPPPPSSGPNAPKASTKPAEKSTFGTIASLHQEESDSDEEQGEAFYAGGSEHGAGLQVLGPPKKKNPDKFVQDMFQSAKDHGATSMEEEGSQTGPKKGPIFKGTAYRLGDTEGPSLSVPGFPARSQPSQVDMVLKLWKSGFSINGGPLREYSDVDNQEFLSAIKKGEVPRELIREAKGGEVNLNMEDHRNEDYTKPKALQRAFGGEGHRLGSPAGNILVGSTPSSLPPSAAAAAASQGPSVDVDSSQPTTSVQIRLSDGSRMVAKFNHSHTVADIRQYIISSRPEFAGANYALMTTFPNKELTDESETLQEANLLNAVLVQRMK